MVQIDQSSQRMARHAARDLLSLRLRRHSRHQRWIAARRPRVAWLRQAAPSHAAALLALVERNGPRKTRIEIFNQARRRFNGLITLSIIDEISCADPETRAFIVQSRRRSDIRRRS
jgi:hypothetical protein